MDWDAVNLPDPQTPVGAKGIAEAAVGAGAGAVRDTIVHARGIKRRWRGTDSPG